MKQFLITTFFILSTMAINKSQISRQAFVEEHTKLNTQFNQVLSDAMNLNQVLSTSQYDIGNLSVDMSWNHGTKPTTHFTYKLYVNSFPVCKFDFQVDGFHNHLSQELSVKNSNTEKFLNDLSSCEARILKHKEDIDRSPEVIAQ